MIQNKLKSIEDTIIWINHEEALFKFPQSSYPDVGDMNVSFLDFFFVPFTHLSNKLCYSIIRLFKVGKAK